MITGSRPGHRMSRSLNATRSTPVAIFHMAAPFSPARDISSGNCKRQNSASIIPSKDSGFQSQEPASPKVSCIGHIKMKKAQREKPSKKGGSFDRAVKDNNNNSNSKLSKLKKLMFGGHHKNNEEEEEEEAEAAATVQGEEEKTGYPSLGQIKRYTSGSYDAKFGTMFVQEGPIVSKFGSVYVEEGPIVAKLESSMLEAVPKEEEEGIYSWKPPALKALKVNNMFRADRFEPKKPFTT